MSLSKAGHTLCDFHPILIQILTRATFFFKFRANFSFVVRHLSCSEQGETRSN